MREHNPISSAGRVACFIADLFAVDRGGKALDSHTNTSAAAPMVCGLIALMLVVSPDLTPAEVKRILCMTAVKIDPVGGEWGPAERALGINLIPEGLRKADCSIHYGFGRVDAVKAVELATESLG